MSAKKAADKICRGICKISRGDKFTITCYKCVSIFHEKCCGLSKMEIEAHKSNEESGLVYLCTTCLITCKKDSKTTEQNELKINELKEVIDTLNANMNSRLLSIENRIENISSKPDNSDNDNNLTLKLGKIEESLCNKVDSMSNQIITSYAEKAKNHNAQNSDQTKVIKEINQKFD